MAERLTDAQLAALERALHRQRTEITAAAARMAGSLDDVRAARSGSDADDEHDPEGPTLSSEWSRISGLSTELEARAASVEGALERVAAGTFGTCIRCGQPIAPDRLDALPAAELCITCARQT
ncbi:TraR/DksA family transcriptional regulator [Subtercola endophyticus]|uniref:TraR/DksA family transcriptional regulator n=1 Tax=Subtercola endophyticus TaxID=2895559 RepID=UPI001E5718CB|nr:TraR/DksA C4-type zinc finger protein [Subtercola endophyticus]UFS58469.1 TraR/DksA C4-type zinc finger protein [Subtercola endophyticus]